LRVVAAGATVQHAVGGQHVAGLQFRRDAREATRWVRESILGVARAA
jgi:hypothetical protein